MPGVFITAEGGEGVGKSAFLRELTRHLNARGIDTRTSREPGGTPSADRIRALFAQAAEGDPYAPETEAFLVSAARAQHVARVIRPTLAKGQWLICDRFADSTRVYQGSVGGLDIQFLEPLIELATGGLTPDITFLLDCDVDIAMARLQNRPQDKEAIERYDQGGLAIHMKIRQAFLELSQQYAERFCVLDATKPLEEVVATGMSKLEERGFV